MIAFTTVHKRLVIGALQGLALYLLLQAQKENVWPATNGSVFSSLLFVATVVPVLAMLGLSVMRVRSLVLWTCTATVMLVVLAVYEMARRSGLDAVSYGMFSEHKLLPSFSLSTFVVIGFMIAQSLVVAGDIEHRVIASYPLYFDVAWKLAIQLNFIVLFVAMFWLVLWTGSGLFSLIKIEFISELIRNDWFAIPVTALASAYAIHVTDVRANLVRGFRTLKLTTLSWLLPIMSLFVAAFVVTLPFQGISLLWATHHTSQIMLGAASWLIVLINAVYQDGTPEHAPGRLMRYSATLGCMLLLPLTLIGIYAVFVRVGEYGWSVHLIEVAACLLVSSGYTIGYVAAAADPQHWLKRIEKTNIYVSFVILAVLVALFTSVADPARLSVADQMNRLKTGKVTMEKFDFMYLRQQGVSYGETALLKLRDEARASGLSTQATLNKIEQALSKQPYMPYPPPEKIMPPTQTDVVKNITVYPVGKTLPDSFSKQDWTKPVAGFFLPLCLQNTISKCEAFVFDATETMPQQIVLMNDTPYATGVVLSLAGEKWSVTGNVSAMINCKGVREALRAGQFKMVPSLDQDVEINGMHIRINQNEACPQE